MRDETNSFHRDVKHIKDTKIARYAANMKIALRKAYGVEDPRMQFNRNGHQKEQNNESYTRAHYQTNHRNNYQYQSNGMSPDNENSTTNRPSILPTVIDNRVRVEMEEELKRELKKKLMAMFG